MKRIFKVLFTVAAAVAAVTSCVMDETGLSQALSANKTAITYDGFSPETVTVELSADGDWYAYTPDWITVEPSHGTGSRTITISAAKNLTKYNELNAPRADVVAFCGAKDTRFSINVNQIGEPGLDATKFFKKINSTAEFDPAVPYLILFEIDGSLQSCLNIACGKDDNSYAYGYTTAAPAPDEEGVITVTKSGMAYNFVPVDGGYAIQQPNGAYLYQSSSYANFYLTTDLSKASVWTVDVVDGKATITNTSAGDRILQYDVAGYKDFGAWQEVASGYILPYLYKDSAQPTGEVLSAEESLYVISSATSVKIPISANRTWKVRNHDDWVSSFTTSGEGEGELEVTFEENAGDETRTAVFQVIGETTNVEVSLVQSKALKSVTDLNDWIKLVGGNTDYEVALENATVSYISGNNVFIEDEDAGILLYQSGHGLNVGDSFTGKISGNGTMYGGAPELTKWVATEAVKSTADAPRTEVKMEDLYENFDKYVSRVVVIKDVMITDGLYAGDRKGVVAHGMDTMPLYAKVSSGVVIPENSEGDLLAIPCYDGTKAQLGVWATADFTATVLGGFIEMPSALEIENGDTASLNAKVNSGQTITYTSSNDAVATVSSDGTVTALATGEAVITAEASAADGYTAATATCKVTVVAPAPKYVLTQDQLPTEYGNDTVITVDGVDFYVNKVACYNKGTGAGQGIQFRKSEGYVANKTPIEKKITSIVISKGTGFDASGYKVYAGTAEKPEGTEIKATSTANSSTYDLSKGDYTYFKIVNTSTNARYLDSIVIKYAE